MQFSVSGSQFSVRGERSGAPPAATLNYCPPERNHPHLPKALPYRQSGSRSLAPGLYSESPTAAASFYLMPCRLFFARITPWRGEEECRLKPRCPPLRLPDSSTCLG